MYKIAICGKKNTGKDTLANLFIKHFETNLSKPKLSYQSVGFADPIKEILQIAFPTTKKENLYGASELREEPIPGVIINGKPLTYRKALTDLGTDFYGRAYYDDMWDDVMRFKIKENQSFGKCDLFLIKDLRFLREFQLVKNSNFIAIKMLRGKDNSSHISEVEQDSIPMNKFDFICDNNGTIDDLEKWASSTTIKIINSYANNS